MFTHWIANFVKIYLIAISDVQSSHRPLVIEGVRRLVPDVNIVFEVDIVHFCVVAVV